jgi:RHS repeat-associated protein
MQGDQSGISQTTHRGYFNESTSGHVLAVYRQGALQEQAIYGSSRLGLYRGGRTGAVRELGSRQYEISNHLGNVLSVVTDHIHLSPDSAWATVVSTTDYYAFGSSMPGRTFQSEEYRYGFNGKEKDESGEWGSNTHYDYGFRIYNPRIAKFLSVDPLTKEFPWNSTYAFAENDVIRSIDLEGGEKLIVNKNSRDFFNSFFRIINSDRILKEQVRDPINNPELKDKVHIYLVQTNQFGAGQGSFPEGANYNFSNVEKKVNRYINFMDHGISENNMTKQNVMMDKLFFDQAGLDPYLLKEIIDNGIRVHIVAVRKFGFKTLDDAYDTTLHELYLHTKKFEDSNNSLDHIDGYGEDYYRKSGKDPNFSPDSKDVPDSKMGKLWLRFKAAKEKIENSENEN